MKVHELSHKTVHTLHDLNNLLSSLDEELVRQVLVHINKNVLNFAERTYCPACAATAPHLLPGAVVPSCGACGAELVKLRASLYAREYDTRCECGNGERCGYEATVMSLSEFFDSHSGWEYGDRVALLEVGETFLDRSNGEGHTTIIKRIS